MLCSLRRSQLVRKRLINWGSGNTQPIVETAGAEGKVVCESGWWAALAAQGPAKRLQLFRSLMHGTDADSSQRAVSIW